MENNGIRWLGGAYLIALFLFATIVVFASLDQFAFGLDRELPERLFEVGADG